MHNEHEHRLFTSSQGRVERFTRTVLAHVPIGSPLRLLEIGCGDGRQLLALAEALADAQCTGVDISSDNIAVAQSRAQSEDSADRAAFIHADYLAWAAERPFDVILADSVFHLMGVPAVQLFDKIAADLAPNGVLIFSMPYDCMYNRMLWTARRVMRAVRGPTADRLIMSIARRLHPDMDVNALTERIIYMYLLPSFAYGTHVELLLQKRHGLHLMHHEEMLHGSLAQPKHAIVAYARTASTVKA